MYSIYYVYFITNRYNTVIYTGSTIDVYERTIEHREKMNPGFTNKYNCNKLVYYEEYESKEEALHRERQLKRYRRKWKEDLINSVNPTWRDLSKDFEVNE